MGRGRAELGDVPGRSIVPALAMWLSYRPLWERRVKGWREEGVQSG